MPNDLRVTEVPATGTREIVVLQNIHKRFGSTHAVNDVSTRFVAGEVHALLGENGAGKSTLGKIVGGLFPPDEGRLLLDGAEVQYRNIAEARSRGVAMVFQELSLVPDLTVRENICLGMEIRPTSVKSAGKAARKSISAATCLPSTSSTSISTRTCATSRWPANN